MIANWKDIGYQLAYRARSNSPVDMYPLDSNNSCCKHYTWLMPHAPPWTTNDGLRRDYHPATVVRLQCVTWRSSRDAMFLWHRSVQSSRWLALRTACSSAPGPSYHPTNMATVVASELLQQLGQTKIPQGLRFYRPIEKKTMLTSIRDLFPDLCIFIGGAGASGRASRVKRVMVFDDQR